MLVSFKSVDDRVQAYVTSDQRVPNIDGTLHVGVLTFDTCGLEMQEVAVKLRANTSASLWESPKLGEALVDPTRQAIVAMLEVRGKIIAKATYFAPLWSEMRFPEPKLLVEREQVDEKRHRLALAANAYARNVAFSNLPALARPSDNYFDLLPGEQYEVFIENITLEEANKLTINVWRK